MSCTSLGQVPACVLSQERLIIFVLFLPFQILEYLIIHLKSEEERQLKGLALEGIVLVSTNLSDSTCDRNQLQGTTTIAAAGNFCSTISNEQIWKVRFQCSQSTRLGISTPGSVSNLRCDPRWLDSGHNSVSINQGNPDIGSGGRHHGAVHFADLQALHERPGDLMMDCLAVKQFIHKISMVHPKIRFHYCVNVNGAVSAETYCGEKRESTFVLNGIKLLTDRRHYMRVVDSLVSCGANFLCDKIHPLPGKAVNLLIPHKVAETGFTGELEVTPAATLCPCLKLYPNQPAKIAAVSIFFYDPAGLPVSFDAKGKSSLFFSDPSNIAEWEKYNYRATLDTDPGQEEDQVSPEVRYKLHWDGGSHEEDPDTWEQTLLLFLFLHYSDPFQDKPSYDFWARRLIASHLDQILLCSQQAVKHGAQAVIDAMLEEHCKRGENQRKLKLSLPVILNSISSVVSSSTNSQFRQKCLQSLQIQTATDTPLILSITTLTSTLTSELEGQRAPTPVGRPAEGSSAEVADTPELMAAIQSAFENITRKRLMPSVTCNITKQVLEDANPAWLSACDLPTSGQKLSQEEASDSITSVDSEPAFLLDKADLWGEMSETKRRKTANMEKNAGVAPKREPPRGSQAKTDDLMTDFGSQLSSCLWCPREGADASMFLGEREEGFTAVSESEASSSENLWQNILPEFSFAHLVETHEIDLSGVGNQPLYSSLSREVREVNGRMFLSTSLSKDSQSDHLWLQEISNLSEWTS